MPFSGDYVLESHENFKEFAKAVGLTDKVIGELKDNKTVAKIEQNGKHFVITETTGSLVLRNEFTLDEEAEIQTITGQKLKGIVRQEDGKLVVKLKEFTITVEISGNKLISYMIIGDIKFKRVFKKKN